MADQPTSVLSKELLPASVAIFMSVGLAAFEGLAVAAALPQVAGDLGGVELLPWVITGFLLTAGVATVVSGPLIDSLGVSRIFRYAVVVFAAAGFAAAFAPTMAALVALRIVQGIGAGLLVASGLSAVALVFPSHLVGRAYAANSTIWGVMGVAGPAIAAFMLTVLSWRWIFIVNLPLGLAALAFAWRVLPGPQSDEPAGLDVRGALLVTAFSVATLLAFDALGPMSAVWLAMTALLVWLYVRHSRSVESPVVRLEHIWQHPYGTLGLGTGLMLAGAFAVNAYVPLFVRAGLSGSSSLTAWSVLFLTVGWTLGANAGSRQLDRHSESWLTLVGLFITVPALIATSGAVLLGASLVVVFGAQFLAGMGIGVTTNAGLTLLRAVTPAAEVGRATAAHQFARNQGFTYGAALGGAILLLVIANQLGDVEVVRSLLAGETESVGAETSAAVRTGFGMVAAAGSVVAAAGLGVLAHMRRRLAVARRERRGPS